MVKAAGRNRKGALVAILSLVLSQVWASPAWAVNCGAQKEQFFIRETANRIFINGTLNKIWIANRPLDTDCVDPATLSTAHLSRDLHSYLDGYQVEVGWREEDDFSGGPHDWELFAHKQAAFNTVDYYQLEAPLLNPGEFDFFKVENNPAINGTTRWELRVNLGQGYGLVREYFTDYHHGHAYGEAEAFGNDTGLHDEQRLLRHYNNSNEYVDWVGQKCEQDTSLSHNYQRNSDTSYDIVAGIEYC